MQEIFRLKSFNSTLVQLKGWCRMKTAWTEKCFNSTLVQLKVLLVGEPGCGKTSFNSTLVQLKVPASSIAICL